MQWRKFVALSKSYRDMQISLLCSACPEAMDLKGLTGWGKLCSKSLAYAYKVEADTAQVDQVREHWGEIRAHAVLQLERTAKAVVDYMGQAEELTAWERCQIFELAGLCSSTFQDEADAIQLQLAAQGELSAVPMSVSADTLAQLAKLKGRSKQVDNG